MRTQFYAIGIADDQSSALSGLMARQHGTLASMQSFRGHPLGANTRFYADLLYEIARDQDAEFMDDLGGPLPGAIYTLVERAA